MLYIYRATVLHVVDGDTVDLAVSLGFEMSYKARFRLVGINTPESYGPAACDEGRAAKQYLIDTLKEGTPVIVRTTKDKKEKYGRFLAEVFLFDGAGKPLDRSINQMLIDAGHAKPYFGGARD
ncbi:MAG: nuclease [Actinobacteria bacterium]|nr:nuclease [Actinomycetota bacterium]NBR67333.1 nuclease [Actinomycetota bacterium]